MEGAAIMKKIMSVDELKRHYEDSYTTHIVGTLDIACNDSVGRDNDIHYTVITS